MKELTSRALNLASVRGARYADIRVVETREQVVGVKNGAVDGLGEHDSRGFGVRVLYGDSWGFASSSHVTAEAIDRATDLAVGIARASALVPGDPVDLGPPVLNVGRYVTPMAVDPFGVSLEAKLDLLFQADALMRRSEAIKVADGRLVAIRREKTFASTEGSFLEQVIYESGCGIQATAVSGDEIQVRSYPNSFRYQGTAGWEYVADVDLAGNAERVGDEAVALLSADICPAKQTTLILGSSQLALQIHESCGHPAELDRVYGTEAAFAGRSFLTTDKLQGFRYGSELVNITADSVRETGLGTFGWDDEGVAASRRPLVTNGRFVGYLMSRETASRLSVPNNGCMRAESWNRLPLIRMTNVSLEAGSWNYDDLIADTDEGVLMETNRSWSIDDMRLNFQFGTEVGYEIKGGRLGRLLKNCIYSGITPEFWDRCDGIGDEKSWKLWGTPNCGKGEPMQTMGTGHGTAPARFRDVQVGVAR